MPRHLPGTPGYRALNVGMALIGLAAFGLLYATQPLLPRLSAHFAVDATTASLSLSVTTGTLALLVVPATWLGQRFGRRRVMRAGLVASVVLMFACAAAPTFATLLVLRAASGAALAAVVGVAMGHVAAEVHPSGLGAAMGLYVAGNSVGGVTGRLVSSIVVDVAGWRWALAAIGLLGLVATVLFWRLLPPPTGPVTAGPSAAEGRAGVWRDPALLALLAVPFLLMGGFVAAYNFLTYRLTAAPFDVSEAVIGAVFLTYLAGTAASALAGRAADRVGRPPVLLASIALMGAGLLLTLPPWLPTIALGLLIFTAGFFGAHSTASGWAPVVGAARPATAGALYVFGYYAGSSVFGAAVGIGWHAGGWPLTVALIGVLIALAALAATLTAVGTSRRPAVSRSERPKVSA
ncbi:MFS transporter [Cryptosporangium arvum]|uniref:MFS transporter n=1 Tax=Cryptosporangium arvum TaxID=80871 RepID=UPI0004B93C73|nr:MFS transporter [Cryptosporangium arvum]